MNAKINEVLQTIRHNQEQQDYLFRNAPKYPNLYLWLEPLYNEGYFDPKNNPFPIEDPKRKGSFRIPSWNILEFLEAVAVQNREVPIEKVTNKLIEIVDNIMNSKIDGKHVDNYFTDWFMIKIIFLMPPDKVTLQHIEFIRTSMLHSRFSSLIDSEIGNIIIPYLLKHTMTSHMLKLIEILLEYDINKNKNEKTPLIETYWLQDALNKYSKQIAKLIGKAGLFEVLSVMQNIIEKDPNSFDDIWIVTIEEHIQNSFTDRYENIVTSFVRDMLKVLEGDDLQDTVKYLLGQEHSIFIRLAIHAMNYHYDNLQSIFWDWFSVLQHFDSFGKHELYQLFVNHSREFTEEQFDHVIEWIKQLEFGPYADDEKKEIIEAYRRKEWLLPLKNFNKKAENLYDQYHLVYPEEVDHPGLDYWTESRIGNESPISCEELELLEATSIVEYIQNFDPNQNQSRTTWKYDLKIGLGDTLTVCVKDNPDNFLPHLDNFLPLEKIFIYHLIFGFENAWRNKCNFDWSNLFDFFDNLLENDFFSGEDQYSRWSIGLIANLIHDGMKDDSFCFDKNLLSNAKQILLKLLKINSESHSNTDDVVSVALNNPVGKILFALMGYSLRVARLGITNGVDRWDPDIKGLFDQYLKLDNDSLVIFHVTLGMYLKNLLYLDEKWVFKNFHLIFPLDKDNLWNATMEGYFSGGGSVYENIYTRLNSDGHIQKAIQNLQSKNKIKKSVMQHICVAYMNNFDDKTIFKIQDPESIKEIVWFIWSAYRQQITDDIRNKVLQLWRHFYEEFNGNGRDEEEIEQLFSKLALWFVFIDVIEEKNIELYKLSASLCGNHHNNHWIIEELLRLSEKYPIETSNIFLNMLKSEILPFYPQEKIVSLVECFFQNEGSKNNAIEICNKYAQRKNYLLTETFTKFQKL